MSRLLQHLRGKDKRQLHLDAKLVYCYSEGRGKSGGPRSHHSLRRGVRSV